MFVLGIVGGIACGKSTVASYLESLGATWINADNLAKSFLDDEDVQKSLIGHFGGGVRASDGTLDRSELAKLVFGDDDSNRAGLLYLEGLIHPRVRNQIHEILVHLDTTKLPVAVLDVPLLFESNWHYECDSIWCVDAPQEMKIQRIQSRGWSEQELLDREANQLDLTIKRRLSNWFIENASTPQHLHHLIDVHFTELLKQIQLVNFADRHCNANNL